MGTVPDGRGCRVVGAQPGFLGQLACRRGPEVLIDLDEAPGQRPSALERRLATANHQRAQRMTAHGEHNEVDGDSEGREGRRVVGRHAVIIVVCLTINTPFVMLFIRSGPSAPRCPFPPHALLLNVRRKAARPVTAVGRSWFRPGHPPATPPARLRATVVPRRTEPGRARFRLTAGGRTARRAALRSVR